tara:strand:+ start:51 stop:443 length:393 start_codon:yes stop_codon:yes gene_type:complete
MQTCPCGNELPFFKCCGAIHTNEKNAETAEELMRSRYSAFVLADWDYLMKSHASQTRDESSKEETVNWAKSVKWIKLEILDTLKGNQHDNSGIVEFKAHVKQGLFKRCIHERSNFIKENGKWVYLNGAHF